MQIPVTNRGGAQSHINVDAYPDKCPICHHAVHATFIAARESQKTVFDATFWCPNDDCRRTMVARYVAHPRGVYQLFETLPHTALKPDFAPDVEGISPTFVAIMGQVEQAEAAGLDHLVGIGLRKALEFLIKDYAGSLNPADDAAIKASTLAQCITRYITDVNVKACAERAAWLGNDETHYIRKWDSKDVKDLRTLVHLVVNWIDNSLLTKKYLEGMQRGAGNPAA